jgi:hypothetical protein
VIPCRGESQLDFLAFSQTHGPDQVALASSYDIVLPVPVETWALVEKRPQGYRWAIQSRIRRLGTRLVIAARGSRGLKHGSLNNSSGTD